MILMSFVDDDGDRDDREDEEQDNHDYEEEARNLKVDIIYVFTQSFATF